MIRKALVAMIFTALWPMYAMASLTSDRSAGLGDYPWMAGGTYSTIFENAAWLSSFRNNISFERIGAKEGDNIGALTVSPVKCLTLGVFTGMEITDAIWNTDSDQGLFHNGEYDIHSGSMEATLLKDASISIDLNDPESAVRNALERKNVIAMAAYEWNTMCFGLSIGYSSSFADDEYNRDDTVGTADASDDYLFSNQQYDIGLSWLYRITEKLSVDASTSYTMYIMENTYSTSNATTGSLVTREMSYKSDGAFDLGFRTSVAWRFSQGQVLHGRIGYSYLSRSVMARNHVADAGNPANDTNATDLFDRSGNRIILGASDEIFISDRIRFHGGIVTEIEMFNRRYTGKDTIIPASDVDRYTLDSFSVSFPVVAGLETRLGNYWIWRFGVISRIYRMETAELTSVSSDGAQIVRKTTRTSPSPETELSTGFSLVFGDFTIDWLVNADIFVEGPYFLSGNIGTGRQPGVPVSTSLAVRYSFDSVLSRVTSGEGEKKEKEKPAEPAVRGRV